MNERVRVSKSRSVETVHAGRATEDGDGVRLVRLLGAALQRRLDPFLMLDRFGSERPEDYLGGFPEHPHRGFETITYMIAGRMRHRDSAGHEGLLETGGVQWMCAARGVVHSEMPEQKEGRMTGFQLWLNLPAASKMDPPWYRDFASSDLPRVRPRPGVEVVVLAGRYAGVAGAVERPVTEPLILDVRLEPGAVFEGPLDRGVHAFLVPYDGEATVEGRTVPKGMLAVLDGDASADGVRVSAKEATRFLLAAGRPLGEPVVQYGPFVMNTEEEIRRAVADYRSGALG